MQLSAVRLTWSLCLSRESCRVLSRSRREVDCAVALLEHSSLGAAGEGRVAQSARSAPPVGRRHQLAAVCAWTQCGRRGRERHARRALGAVNERHGGDERRSVADQSQREKDGDCGGCGWRRWQCRCASIELALVILAAVLDALSGGCCCHNGVERLGCRLRLSCASARRLLFFLTGLSWPSPWRSSSGVQSSEGEECTVQLRELGPPQLVRERNTEPRRSCAACRLFRWVHSTIHSNGARWFAHTETDTGRSH